MPWGINLIRLQNVRAIMSRLVCYVVKDGEGEIKAPSPNLRVAGLNAALVFPSPSPSFFLLVLSEVRSSTMTQH